VQITLDTYSHVIPGLDEQAAATVARLILEGPDTTSTGSSGSVQSQLMVDVVASGDG
jgi:N-acetylmuramic acid 6-phosphate (MurNAc-6-P) etherase